MHVHIYVYGKPVFMNTFQIQLFNVQHFKSPKCLSSVFSLKRSKYLYILSLPRENLNRKFGRELVKLTMMSAYFTLHFLITNIFLVTYTKFISLDTRI